MSYLLCQPFFGGGTAINTLATNPVGDGRDDGRDDGRWREPGAGSATKYMGPMARRRYHGFLSQREIDRNAPLFGVDTVLWPMAATQAVKCYQRIVKAADGFMARWHRVGLEKIWGRHANEDPKRGAKQG